MGHAPKPAAIMRRKPFFGEISPAVAWALVFLLGLAAITVFYASVFAAAHALAATGGGTRAQFGRVGAWVCALFLLQGLVPLVRFGISELPRLVIGGIRLKWRDMGLFLVLLIAGMVLFLL